MDPLGGWPTGTSAGLVWVGGLMVASCGAGPAPHREPVAGCGGFCGVHLVGTPEDAVAEPPAPSDRRVPVMGWAQVWGTVVVHERGVRAAAARIGGMVVDPDDPAGRAVAGWAARMGISPVRPGPPGSATARAWGITVAALGARGR